MRTCALPDCHKPVVRNDADTCSYQHGYELRSINQKRQKDGQPPLTAKQYIAAEKVSTRTELTDEDAHLLGILRKAKNRLSETELSEELNVSERSIRDALGRLRAAGHNIHGSDKHVKLVSDVVPGNSAPLLIHPVSEYSNQFRVFGATGDNHLGSKHERLDVLNALYDLYESEGVTEVFNTGNWIEGEAGKMNFSDIKVFGLDDQVDYFIDKYPQRKGITTYFVAGDDHEGWYQKRERIEIGKYAMLRAKAAGREDLVYLGYVEADIELKAQNGSRMMKVVHPGGGSAYALSYSMQKWVEALQGGEKPSVVLAGHYHKFDYNYYREVFIVQTGCTVDQSVFMRKQKIQAHVGGTLIRINQAPDGRINRFQVEWCPFYDRGFYHKAWHLAA